ncbi:MAG: hypothetical protein EZS28_000639 [Streblomastix strix]|uniref:Uncharacterized protein n=1 Tax=Streblomastix strix TaxID=222440 RepID=A0A5J4XAL6_9EUKA|nr:MAG: hypothetical protein EZS28_000639 [Streblomastix strix]
MAAGIFNTLQKLIAKVGRGVNWINNKIVKPIMPITNALLQSFGPAGSMVAKGISAGSSAVDALQDYENAYPKITGKFIDYRELVKNIRNSTILERWREPFLNQRDQTRIINAIIV